MPRPDNEKLITPVFKTLAERDEKASKAAGRPIYRDVEMVEIHIAGDRNFRPCYPALSFWKNIDGLPVTYAERWPEQYRRFKEGAAQLADGTPLAELPFLTQAKRAELKALSIYTAEALAALDGKNLKTLGIGGRELKDQAQAYLDKAKGSADITALAKDNAAMKVEIERLKALVIEGTGKTAASSLPVAPELVDPPSEYETWGVEELKNHLAGITGARPKGNPSRETLIAMVEEAEAGSREAA